MIIAGGGLAAAATLAVPAWRHWRETPPAPPRAVRLQWPAPGDLTVGAGVDHPFGLSLAPDGRRVAFPATRGGITQLWLQDVTTGALRALPDTEGGVWPFWSPDARQLGFFKSGRLLSQSLESGRTVDLGAVAAPRGAVWHPNGDIILASTADGGLARRRAADGQLEPLTMVDRSAGESGHRFPVLRGGGEDVVFFVRARDSTRQGIWIAPLDRPSERVRLSGSEAHGLAVDNWIIYARDNVLYAQELGFAKDLPAAASAEPNRPARLSLTGRPRMLGTTIGHSALNQLSATLGADLLIYGAPQPRLRLLEWIDHRGITAGRLANQVDAWEVRIAPDGRRVAVTQVDSELGTLDIFVYEVDRPLPLKISQAIDVDESPVWSPDASRVAWVSGRRTITVRGAQAQLPERAIRRFDGPVRLWDWSPDGQYLIVGQTSEATKNDLWILPASGTGEPAAYASTPFNEREGVVSRDGRWMAYASDESGRSEIYVDSFPTPGHRARITIGGGSDPRWRPAARSGPRPPDDLFFRSDGRLLKAAIVLSGSVPQVWDMQEQVVIPEWRAYDASPDAQRFLFNRPVPDVEARPMTAVVNWRSLLLGWPGTGGPR